MVGMVANRARRGSGRGRTVRRRTPPRRSRPTIDLTPVAHASKCRAAAGGLAQPLKLGVPAGAQRFDHLARCQRRWRVRLVACGVHRVLDQPHQGPRCDGDVLVTQPPTNRWARVVSNHRPLACEASALPLSYAPEGPANRYVLRATAVTFNHRNFPPITGSFGDENDSSPKLCCGLGDGLSSSDRS